MAGGAFKRSLQQAMRQVDQSNVSGRSLVTGALAVGGAVAMGAMAYQSFYRVEPGHAAVIFSRWSGVGRQVYTEGLQFKMPWLHTPLIFATRVRPTTYGTLTGSKDLQTVNITLRILYKPMIGNLADICETLGPDYDDRVLPSIANEVLKGVVAKFNAAQLVMERELVSSMIQQRLRERAKEFFLELEDVSITHLTFSPEYAKAVERKQVAQQEAERAKYTVERALQEKRSIVIKAQGDGDAARLVNEAILTNPYFLELRRLEAAKEIATIISTSSNKVFTNSDSLLLNLFDGSPASTTLPSSVSSASNGKK